MAHFVKISDDVLINNLYRILCNEFEEFRNIFVKIGVASNNREGGNTRNMH